MIKINTALVISMLLIATPVFAKPDIALLLTSKKLVDEKGKQTLIESKKATPGDILVYSLKVWNKGNTAALNLQPVGNIPPNTVYLPEKTPAKDYRLLFSIDNGKTFSEQPMIKVAEKGKMIQKKAPASLYNRIKWSFSTAFEPKQSLELTYKVKVK